MASKSDSKKTSSTSPRCSTRRQFLRSSASALAVPYVISSSSLGLAGTVAPSERITLGLIGCGIHGAGAGQDEAKHGLGWSLNQIFRNDDAQLVAVCDVDQSRVEMAKRKVDEHYAKTLGEGYQGCTAYGDFRELIRQDGIDAVAVVTPDHWHVIPAIMAAKAGKDVVCEKPLTLFVEEGRILCDVIAAEGRVFQTASENRSIDTYIQICELVRNGRIGTLKHVDVILPIGNAGRGENFNQRDEQPVPEGFNYEMWLGQAPHRPYVPARTHGSFRWCSDYSGGILTDWGAHLIDLAQWANGTDRSGPVEIAGRGTYPPSGEVFDNVPDFNIDFVYANGVTMNVSNGTPGVRFEGTDGWIGFNGWRAPLEASNPEILESTIGPDETHLHRPRVVVPGWDGGKGGEYRDFIDCVKSRDECYAPAEIGHRTITVAHIGNISMRLGRHLRWNPDIERFDGDDEANAMLSRPQREPWTIENIDSWLT